MTEGALRFFLGVFHRAQQRGEVIPHQKFVLPDAGGGSPSVQNPGERQSRTSSEFESKSFHTAAGCSICSANHSGEGCGLTMVCHKSSTGATELGRDFWRLLFHNLSVLFRVELRSIGWS